MSRHPFSKEDQMLLNANPFTLSVNDKAIRFTVAFKKFILTEVSKPGMTIPKALRKAGYNPAVFGKGADRQYNTAHTSGISFR